MCYECYEFKLSVTTKLHMWHHNSLLSLLIISVLGGLSFHFKLLYSIPIGKLQLAIWDTSF